MVKNLLFFVFLNIFSTNLFASTKCFIVIEDDNILEQEGDCEKRYTPCSTFKVALSLMGYNEGILIDEENPKWQFEKGYVDYVEAWQQAQTPISWMKNSCVWYSQILAQKIGLDNFKNYIEKFDYGNNDISGNIGKNNGLTNAWLSSSLEISPKEQTDFLQKLINSNLPVTLQAHEMTKKLLFIEELEDGWKLYGKTGSGSSLNTDRTEKLDSQIGWFIGWLQKGSRHIIFVNLIEDEKRDNYASVRAIATAKEKLLYLIKNNNKVK